MDRWTIGPLNREANEPLDRGTDDLHFWREGWGLVSIINVDIMHCHQDVVDVQIIDLLVHQSPFPLTLFSVPCNCQQQAYLTSGQ